MANKSETEVAGAKPENLEEVNKLCREFKEIPMADILVEAFLEQADPESFLIGKGFDGKEIAANPQRADLHVSMKISRLHDRVDLEIFDGSTQIFLQAEDWDKPWGGRIAWLIAGQKDTGTWAAGKGYEHTYGIMARLIDDLKFPSERAQWVLEVIGGIVKKTNERYSLNQPKFFLLPKPARVQNSG